MTTQSIAQKNDIMRRLLIGCRVVLTAGVAQSEERNAIIATVQSFNAFNKGNDPYGERDFAFFEVNRERYFFKFDYYDTKYEFFQEDGHRVLTIGRADEY